MPDYGHQNLEHVLEDTCTDNDCELHNIDVAVSEQVISENDLAMWLAGAMWMYRQMESQLEDLVGLYDAARHLASTGRKVR